MATAERFGVDISELDNGLSIHELDDAHCVLLVEPRNTGGEVTSIVMEEGWFDGLDGALIILEGVRAITKWVTNAGSEITNVDGLLDAVGEGNDLWAKGMKSGDDLFLASPSNHYTTEEVMTGGYW
jgi:hypothetical protein